ncbi:guanylate kinase, partial [Enterococcus faecalis]
MSERGLLMVLSGPSVVWKGTVRKAIFVSEENDFQYSISMSSWKQREGGVDGVDYYYRSREEFEAMIE